MASKQKDLFTLIELFRVSDNFRDVVGQRIAFLTVPRIIEEIIEYDKIEFTNALKTVLNSYFMSGRYGEKAFDNIISYNSYNELKKKLKDMYLSNKSPSDKLKSIKELNNVGIFFGTSLLSVAYDDKYIIYHKNVLKGIKELDCTWLPISKVNTNKDYFIFNDICIALKELYGFKSLAEVHEFFWHGIKTDWKFG